MLLLPSQQDRARILSASPIAASSRRHADHPTTAPNVAIEARPGEVARVPAAGVANVDAPFWSCPMTTNQWPSPNEWAPSMSSARSADPARCLRQDLPGGELPVPMAGLGNERLQERRLGLDRVDQVVRRPRVHYH